MTTTMIELMDSLSSQGELVESLEHHSVRCVACANRCVIKPGMRGYCQVRFNREGNLQVPWGYVAGMQIDPIEKKPFSHLLPGSDALTFGMLGCDFHCSFCQNWMTSQTMRDPAAGQHPNTIREITPLQIVRTARQADAAWIVSSYNEPLITSEWAVEIFKLAIDSGIKCAFVSNGNATTEALEYLHPYLTALKIDLKSMQERNYRELGGVLKNVLDTIQKAYLMGIWVEVVTLVIPGYNDSNDELWEAARYLSSVSPDIPWHVTAFHPDYQMQAVQPTPVDTLKRAAEIGQEAGLRYVYAGNLPGKVGTMEDTHCPNCQSVLVKRKGYIILAYNISANGTCPDCGTSISGVWTDRPETVKTGGWGMPKEIW